MTRYLLMLAALLFSVPYAEADSIVDVQGSPVAGGLAITSTQSLSETWTQPGTYYNENISAWLYSGYQNGQPSTSIVTAWLTGGGITLSNTFDLSSPFASLVPLFSVTSLAPGRYNLILTSQDNAGWVWGPETGQPVTVFGNVSGASYGSNGNWYTLDGPLFFEVWGDSVDTDPAAVAIVATPEPPTAAEILVTVFGLCLGYYFTRMVITLCKR